MQHYMSVQFCNKLLLLTYVAAKSPNSQKRHNNQAAKQLGVQPLSIRENWQPKSSGSDTQILKRTTLKGAVRPVTNSFWGDPLL